MNRKRTGYQANSPVQQPVLMFRQEPAKKTTNLETEVIIPTFHALIITLAWTLPSLLIAGLLVWITHSPWYMALLVLILPCIIFPVTVSRFIRQQRALLWKTEETHHQPSDAKQTEAPHTFKVEIQDLNSKGYLRGITNLDFGLPDAKALQFIRQVLTGAPITESHWTGKDRLFSKREYNPLRDMLIARRLFQWRNPDAPSQGVVLTDRGRQAFEQIITQEP